MADKVFPQIIKVQWWGSKGDGKKLGTDPTTNPYLNAPLPMLALTAAVVCKYFFFLHLTAHQ